MSGVYVANPLARRVRIPTQVEPRGGRSMKRSIVASAVMATLFFGLGLAGCEKGPVQKAGEKVDEVTGQDKVIGKGPAEKAGRKIDNTVGDMKK